MMNSAIFIQQSPDFQFLNICHYLNVFGIFFYNKDLITFKESNQTIPILNTLFEYFHNSKNESEAKLQLLRIVLKESDFHGGRDDETLDMKYVNETYQHIISTALFSHYGNINGYLAGIINKAENITFSALRKKIIHKLHKNYITRDYCSLSNGTTMLTKLAIRKVFEDHIWSIFPQPEQDMSIIDVNYIYAMVGLKIVRSVAIDVVDLKFHEYILISREIDLQQFKNETYHMVLKLFSTPALFFYAFKLKDKYRKMEKLRIRNQFDLNDEFWSEAYENLFSYISNSVQETVNEVNGNSLHYKLDKEINNLMSRTLMAYEILKVFCYYDNVAQVSELLVGLYKTFYHWITKLVLPNRCRKSELPELEQVYKDQFDEVEKIYNQIETNAIEKVVNDGELIKELNPNAIVLIARLPDYHQGCNLCSPPPRSKNKDIYLLFAIKEKKTNFYALRQENNTLTLLRSNGNEQEFSKAVSNYTTLKMEIAKNAITLKYLWENYKIFVQRVAEIKTEQFVNGLKKYYYDETLGEKYLIFFKSLIPFYNCIESVKSGDVPGAVLSCSIDMVSLLPLAGFSAKYTTQLGNSLAKEIGNQYLITNSLAKLGTVAKVPIVTALNQITKTAIRTVAREILTRGFLKDFAVASLRSVDPGFELFYQVSNFGFKTFRKLFRNIIANFKNIPKVAETLSIIKVMLKIVKRNMNLIPDQTGLVPLILAEQNGFNIIRYLYPGGSNPFGPTCLTSYGRTAELRSIEGYPFEIAVMPVKSPGDVTHYKQYIPETGKILENKLQMGSNDILRRVGYLLNELYADGLNINLFRNYDVYHNTINWNNPPPEAKATENLNEPIGNPNSLGSQFYQEEPLHSGDASFLPANTFPAENYFSQFDFIPSDSQIQQFLAENTELYNLHMSHAENLSSMLEDSSHDFLQMTGIESLGTVQENLSADNFFQSPKSQQSASVLGTSKENTETDPSVANPTFSLASDQLLSSADNPIIFSKSISNSNTELIPTRNNPQDVQSDLSSTAKVRPITSSEFVTPKKTQNLKGYLTEYQDTALTFKSTRDIINEYKNSIIAKKIRRVDDLPKREEEFLQYVPENLDDIPGGSKQFVTHPDPDFYKAIIKEPTYSRYVEVLLNWKKYGLPFLKQDKVQVKFLRNALNKLALFQLDVVVSSQKPTVLWFTEVVSLQRQVKFLQNLKGNHFFFNDITMLTKNLPGPSTSKKLDPSLIETEIRYRLSYDYPFGLVDLTQFHEEFRDNYVTFNDMLFTVTDTYFINDQNILIVELKSQGKSKQVWQRNREKDIINLMQDVRTIETPRMKSITDAANFIANNAPMSTFTASRDFLTTYILNTKPSGTNSVPTYQMFAEDIRNMEFRSIYDFWKIKPHRYIQDVLLKSSLDKITELAEAERRIMEIYGMVYYQDIKEAFQKYRRIIGGDQRLRFEDYYALYSHARNKLVMTKDGVRRYEVAINRLCIRQCDEDWITNPIVLYRAELISQEVSSIIQSFEKKKIIVFDELKLFSLEQKMEEPQFSQPESFTFVPLLIQIKLINQAGVADVGRVVNDHNVFHAVTSNFQFVLRSVRWQSIGGRNVLVLQLRDLPSPVEKRMVQMANKLYELFSTETKYYSDLKE